MEVRNTGIINVSFGEGVVIMSPCNIYGCALGNHVFVGPFCEIQSDVFVLDNTRIQSHSFICSMVRIGSDCFIGHGVVFINDDFRSGGPCADQLAWKGAIIGDRVSIGSNATVMPVRICDNAVIGCGSVVTSDILTPGIYAGNPARMIRKL